MPRSGCSVLHGVNPIFLKKIIGLEILSDRPIFSAHHQEQGSFDSKHGKWEKRKRKNKSLFLKYLQTATSKATQPLRYDDPGKVKPLQSDVVVYLQLFPIRIS